MGDEPTDQCCAYPDGAQTLCVLLSRWQVLCDTYVKSDSGTGVVHQAPAFGEEDYRIGLKAGESHVLS